MAFDEARRIVASGTTRRFLVLLCVLVLACAFLFNAIVLGLRPTSFLECAQTAEVDLGLPWPELFAQSNEVFTACRDDLSASANRIALLGTGGVLVVAAALYWVLPAWRVRRRGLLPLDQIAGAGAPSFGRAGTTSHPQLAEHLRWLVKRAGVAREPRFAVDPRAMTAGAVVIGRGGRYTVCLDAGLIPARVTDPAVFDSVVLHELAHIRNRDVDITYVTLMIWRVAFWAAVVPYLAMQAWSYAQIAEGIDARWAEAAPSLDNLATVAILVALVYLTRSDVLRNRELRADLDAMALGADPAVWDSHLARDGRTRSGTRQRLAAAARRLGRHWRTHPTWRERRESLERVRAQRMTNVQAAVFIGAMYLTVRTVTGMPWPSWFGAVILYVMAPLVLAGWILDRPRLGWEPPVTTERVAGRPDGLHVPKKRTGWLVAAFLAGAAVLLVADPVGGLRRGGLIGGLGFPEAYRGQQPSGVSAATTTAVSQWLDNGGRDVIVKLADLFAVDPVSFAPSEAGDAYRDHCHTLEQAVSAAGSLPPLPEFAAQLSWQFMLLAGESGSEALCSPDLDMPWSRRVEATRGYYRNGLQSYDQLRTDLDRYLPGGLSDR